MTAAFACTIDEGMGESDELAAAEQRLAPPVGTVVQYRQRRGSQAWLPAIVTVTEETFVAGRWEEAGRHGMSPSRQQGIDSYNSERQGFVTLADSEGEVFVVSELPPVKRACVLGGDDGDEFIVFDYVHLRVLSPTGQDYSEFNVLAGEDPGEWRYIPE